MLLVNCETKSSKLHGLGLFALQSVDLGEVVAIWSLDSKTKLLREEEIFRLDGAGKEEADSLYRHFGDIYFYSTRPLEDDERINHSESPNLICLCGVCVAKEGIEAGDELTLDYRPLCPPKPPTFASESYMPPGPLAEDWLRQTVATLSSLLTHMREARNRASVQGGLVNG